MSSTDSETRPQREPSPEPRLVTPPPLIRLTCYALVGLFLFASVAVLSLAKEFLVPVLLAFLLSMVFGPVRRVFDRRGVPPVVSAIGIILALMLLVAGLMSALIVPASNWINQAPQIERQIQHRVVAISRSFNGVVDIKKHISRMTGEREDDDKDKKDDSSDSSGGPGEGMATSAVMLAPAMLAQLGFTFVLLLFLLASGDMFYEKLVHTLPSFGDKRRAMRIAFSIERKLSRYLMTITLINACVGVAVGLVMSLLGMPDAALIGLAAFLLNFVPYVGPFVGLVLVGAIAAVNYDWLGWAAVAAGSYLGIGIIEGQFVTPYFVGRNLRLNTVVVFVAVSFWAWLWSVTGMVVAVPLLVAVRTFCEHIDGLHFLGDFLSERYAEEEDEARRPGEIDPQ